MRKIHIIGAGLAGLASAVWLARHGYQPVLYEATAFAGGRCRSYHDSVLGRTIDNGNHLLLSANRNAMQYLNWIDAQKTLRRPEKGQNYFPVIDRASGKQFKLARLRPIPGVSLFGHFPLLRLLFALGNGRVTDYVREGSPLYNNAIDLLTTSALNTAPKHASASMLAVVLRRWLLRSKRRMSWLLPEISLDASFIAPALAYLDEKKVDVHFQHGVKEILFEKNRATALRFAGKTIPVEQDCVILAVPPHVAAKLIPGLNVPTEHATIINGHFVTTASPSDMPFVGINGSPVQWAFFKPGLVSTTTSAAGPLADASQIDIANLLWHELCATFGWGKAALPMHRIITETRATFAVTPANCEARPPTITKTRNLLLAGDYVATGLPPTIESAVVSGFEAARGAAIIISA